MGLWSRYIAWVDRDLDEHLPHIQSCLSGLAPVLPFVPAIPLMVWWEPSGLTRLLVNWIPVALSVTLLGIWVWRVIAALRREPPR